MVKFPINSILTDFRMNVKNICRTFDKISFKLTCGLFHQWPQWLSHFSFSSGLVKHHKCQICVTTYLNNKEFIFNVKITAKTLYEGGIFVIKSLVLKFHSSSVTILLCWTLNFCSWEIVTLSCIKHFL